MLTFDGRPGGEICEFCGGTNEVQFGRIDHPMPCPACASDEEIVRVMPEIGVPTTGMTPDQEAECDRVWAERRTTDRLDRIRSLANRLRSRDPKKFELEYLNKPSVEKPDG